MRLIVFGTIGRRPQSVRINGSIMKGDSARGLGTTVARSNVVHCTSGSGFERERSGGLFWIAVANEGCSSCRWLAQRKGLRFFPGSALGSLCCVPDVGLFDCLP